MSYVYDEYWFDDYVQELGEDDVVTAPCPGCDWFAGPMSRYSVERQWAWHIGRCSALMAEET